MTVPLREEIARDFPWLLSDLGFTVTYADWRPQSFGDSVLVLESKDLRVRFVRDRGQVWAEVQVSEKWWPLYWVLEAIRGTVPESRFELECRLASEG